MGRAVVDFYLDYAQVMLERKDYLAIGMLLDKISSQEPEAVGSVLEVLNIIEPKAETKIKQALQTHQARLYRKHR